MSLHANEEGDLLFVIYVLPVKFFSSAAGVGMIDSKVSSKVLNICFLIISRTVFFQIKTTTEKQSLILKA